MRVYARCSFSGLIDDETRRRRSARERERRNALVGGAARREEEGARAIERREPVRQPALDATEAGNEVAVEERGITAGGQGWGAGEGRGEGDRREVASRQLGDGCADTLRARDARCFPTR
jgi:hypothetical protein